MMFGTMFGPRNRPPAPRNDRNLVALDKDFKPTFNAEAQLIGVLLTRFGKGDRKEVRITQAQLEAMDGLSITYKANASSLDLWLEETDS